MTRFFTFACIALASASAQASLVLHLPLNDGPAGSGVTTAAALVNDGTHPTTTATSTGTGDMWMNNATRGVVYYSNQGSRLNAGTQGIDRNDGFTWSLWVKVDSAAAGNSDAGADVLIGTRANPNPWHKVQISDSQNWASINYAGSNLGNDQWRHIAYLGDSTSVRMYIDGVLVGSDATTPTSTYNGPLEIGGSSQFTEDSEGLFNDLGIWNEALTGDEVKALFDITNSSPGLLYDAGEFDLLKQLHDGGVPGTVTIDGLEWEYVGSGLSVGLMSDGNGGYTLGLNSATGSGVQTVSTLIPEPASIALWTVLGLGLAGFARYRRRRK